MKGPETRTGFVALAAVAVLGGVALHGGAEEVCQSSRPEGALESTLESVVGCGIDSAGDAIGWTTTEGLELAGGIIQAPLNGMHELGQYLAEQNDPGDAVDRVVDGSNNTEGS